MSLMFCPSSSPLSFSERVQQVTPGPLRAEGVKVLQVNLGDVCNMSCLHCHIGAGPKGGRIMQEATLEAVLDVLRLHHLVLDITGGAPELHPGLTGLISAARLMGRHVIVRTNLTVLLDDDKSHLCEFFAGQEVELIASLPSHKEDDVDIVRGKGAFGKSVEAVRRLNLLGYGRNGYLRLHFVHNPSGPMLPAVQEAMQEEIRKGFDEIGISFDHLYAFANAPIGRFRENLIRCGGLDSYKARLAGVFNPGTLGGLMCRNLVTAGWDGMLYDCDFNLALGIGIGGDRPVSVREFDIDMLSRRVISVGDHCYACSAGHGFT